MASLSNPLATPDQLYRRNAFSSLPNELQDTIFFKTQCLTQAAGLLLQLPESVTAKANVVLARYWLVDPPMAHEFSVRNRPLPNSASRSLLECFADHQPQDVSAAAIYLTAKLGPIPRPPRDVARVYTYLLSPSSALFAAPPAPPAANDPAAYHLSDAAYHAFQGRLVALEAAMLRALSFDTHVALPHPLAVTYLQALDFLGRRPRDGGLARRALAYLNTALLSPQLLYLTHQPNALAVAAIYNAARDEGAKMPDCPWWEVFDVARPALGFLVVAMRSLEPWAAKAREDLPALWGRGAGMITRRMVEAEMETRGLSVKNGGGGSAAEDEEARMMREMDRRVGVSGDEDAA